MTARTTLLNVSLALVGLLAAPRLLPTSAAEPDAARSGLAASALVDPAHRGEAGQAEPGTPDTTSLHVRRGCDLVREYLGLDTARAPRCDLGPTGVTVEPPLVVVLPDPVESRLDWAFDSGVEAVRRAYERTDFVLDRFWLPWAADTAQVRHAAATQAALSRRHPGVLLFKRAFDAGAAPTLRLVYVVGEVATGGVHQAAFDRALADRDAVLAATRVAGAAADTLDTLRVVGPVFSGSVASVHRRLHHWTTRAAAGQRRHATVISGGATAASNKALVDPTAAGACADDPLAWCVRDDPAQHISFWATVNPVDSLLDVAKRLLRRDLHIPLDRVAVLREASTAFGAAAESGPSRSGELLEVPVPMNISRLRGDLLRALAAAPPVPGTPAPSRAPLDLHDPATERENLPVLSRLSPAAAERTVADIAQTLLAHRVRAVVIVATDVRDRIFLANEVRTRLRDAKVVVIGSHSLYLRPEVNQAMRGTLVVSTYPLFLESQFWDVGTGPGRQRFGFTSDMAAGTFNAALFQLGRGDLAIDYTYPLAAAGTPGDLAVPVSVRVPPVWVTVVGRAGMHPVRAERLGWRQSPSALCDSALGPTTRDARCTAHWYVRARPEHAVHDTLPWSPSRPPLPTVPPSEANLAASAWLDDLLLALVAGFAVVSALGGFRVADGGVLIGLGRLAPARWLGKPRTPERPAPLAWAAHADDPDAAYPWARRLRELELHVIAWTLLRYAALFGIFTPLVLTLLRGRVHGAGALVEWLVPVGVPLAAFGAAVVVACDEWRWFAPLVKASGARARLGVRRPALVALLAVLYVAANAWLAWVAVRGGTGAADVRRAASTVFHARALQVGSGVTPLAPLFVGGLLLLASAAWHLKRVDQLRVVPTFEAGHDDGADPPAAARAGPRADRKGAAVRHVRAHLTTVLPSATARVLAALLLALVVWITLHLERTAETLAFGAFATPAALARVRLLPSSIPGPFDLLLRLLLAVALTLGAWTLFRFAAVWRGLRAALDELTPTALVDALRRLPTLLPELSRLTPFSMPNKRVADATFDAVGRQRWAALREADPAAHEALCTRMAGAAAARWSGGAGDARAGLPLAFGCKDPARVAALGAAYQVLFAAAVPAPGIRADDGPAPRHPLVEELAALYAADYVEWVVRHMRRLAFSLIVTLALAAVLISSYPFEPQSLVKATLFVLMAGSVAALLTVLVQMNRHSVLSAIAHNDAGKVNWDAPFVLNVVLVGAVPALTLLGTQFPEARDFLFSWVTPILRTVGRG